MINMRVLKGHGYVKLVVDGVGAVGLDDRGIDYTDRSVLRGVAVGLCMQKEKLDAMENTEVSHELEESMDYSRRAVDERDGGNGGRPGVRPDDPDPVRDG